ncbi:uncharacterized protein MYCFIDRAFT_87492 [Pseudocercospora fijiensis CIRAD86]|uniref:Uncharacterized protein n=1 Tax=Pseudocercospora fijiensis (strain CIRAD86) TaxID=383855 RepID=M3A301_PSEFD|nr:uncharacterized protein MYCFIDRAFT_87492 [Pseudocercospora fijiensis CIRAD86]EME78981.1 hypothetical protein MYCFIDRAFT_87492 [Pseudocercospora fijiensis CIRAD86]
MGTRSLICVYYKGQFMIAQYAQWDGYPEGQGWDIVQFLLRSSNIKALKTGLQYIKVIESNDQLNQQVVNNDQGPFPSPASLSRETGAKILEIVAQATEQNAVPIVKELGFVNDGLFCEWAYVVDLDKEVLEVYAGQFGLERRGMSGGAERFKEVGGGQVGLLQSISFADLPNTCGEFEELFAVAECDEEAEEDT